MLFVKSLTTYYGPIKILKSVSLHLKEGEIVTVIGANGAGKTTLLKTIAGILPPKKGELVFLNQKINHFSPPQRLKLGLSLCPEGRKLFPELSVKDNILLGAFLNQDKKQVEATFQHLLASFPILEKLLNRKAKSLSGGEQQIVALCRALMSDPKLLLLDEPSLGLSPLLTKEILKTILKLNREKNLSVLLVEQNARAALRICHRAYVLETGRIVLEGSGQDLLNHPEVKEAYLGKGYQEVWERE
ncbi:MAG: branched-chain amino acid transport system ATP-binding protein [Desulfonauticus sp.]|nr:MAG: ABC transporter related protein [Desulfonauticus sp. 38_4375]MDK2921226.1 branched-chain amino acid transport system ATP-binding protein [Desulfonauticus sp.]